MRCRRTNPQEVLCFHVYYGILLHISKHTWAFWLSSGLLRGVPKRLILFKTMVLYPREITVDSLVNFLDSKAYTATPEPSAYFMS